ncbi:DUF6607 family protein [Mesonia sp. K4-1]|uniref:DUF6607 family protein n=1 Tax=Mesonia sp. K4-1 TaxID=2602760 RepID=UPI0011CBC0B4|nr:DUF6607 family protein [Mesonia sp. K4-1]TXK72882.1 hypothetical protein FT986_12770 [Mesonia sp. K4-1]
MNFKNLLLTSVLMAATSVGFAQKNLKEDKQAIKDMCGCFEVTFKYTETFSPEIDYEKHYDYTATALEWAELIKDEKDEISIQHLLVLNDTMVIKHWRQDWLYENTKRYDFNHDNQWTFVNMNKKDVKGQWTQNVYQVDDSPRYSGSATWIHADGRHYWNNTTSSPLPRREYSKRSDYNVMMRGNQVEITKEGWLHEQDNEKVIREDDKEDVLLVEEKGYNVYRKVADEKCKAAKNWWATNKDFWSRVRNKWSDVYGRDKDLALEKAVNGQALFMQLFPMDIETEQSKIGSTVEEYVKK